MAEKYPSDEDINDVFTNILLGEENVIAKSYETGFKEGSTEDNLEGFHLGYHRGAEIGAELGYISSVIRHYNLKHAKNLDSKPNSKVIEVLSELEKSIELFPKWNDPDFDLVQQIDNVRTKFKKLLALLKIRNCDLFKGGDLSF